jgi:hypothetical protein
MPPAIIPLRHSWRAPATRPRASAPSRASGSSLGDRPRKQNPAEAGFCRSAPSNSEGGSRSYPNAPLSPLVATGSPKVRLWRCIGLCPERIAGAVGFGDPITASRWCVPCQGVIPPVLRRVSARRSSGRSTSSPPPRDSRSHARADESAGLGLASRSAKWVAVIVHGGLLGEAKAGFRPWRP